MASRNVRIVRSRQERVNMRQYGVRMPSGWRQDASDGARQASEVCQGSGVGVRSVSGCARMRHEGVRVASGRRQDNLASGWRQDDVKRRGARIKCLASARPSAKHLPQGPRGPYYRPHGPWERSATPSEDG